MKSCIYAVLNVLSGWEQDNDALLTNVVHVLATSALVSVLQGCNRSPRVEQVGRL